LTPCLHPIEKELMQMLTRPTIEAEMIKTHQEIESLQDQIAFKRTYINALEMKIEELNKIEKTR